MEQPDKLVSLIKGNLIYSDYLKSNGKIIYRMNNTVSDQKQYQSNYFDIELLGHVAHVKLNGLIKNAMNWDFWRDLPRIIGDIDRNSSARCIVLSSTSPVFSVVFGFKLFGQDVFKHWAEKKEFKRLKTSGFLSFTESISSLQKLEFQLFAQYRVAV